MHYFTGEYTIRIWIYLIVNFHMSDSDGIIRIIHGHGQLIQNYIPLQGFHRIIRKRNHPKTPVYYLDFRLLTLIGIINAIS